MKIPSRAIACTLLLSTVLCLPALAQQQTPQANQPKEPEYVTSSGFKGRIFEVKNRDPRDIVTIITPLGSGFKGAMIMSSTSNKTITVRDFPENIAVIEEAIKRLDVPLPPQPNSPLRATPADVEITVYTLVASNNETPNSAYPPLLKDVIAQLQTTLNYKGYALLTPFVQRTRAEGGVIQSNGTATLLGTGTSGFSANYKFSVGPVTSERNESFQPALFLSNLRFEFRGASGEDQRELGEASINTNLKIRDGEKVVVGTASLKDKGLILVLMAKVIK